MSKVRTGQVFLDPAEREVETWRVEFSDRLEPARFAVRGAAQAYLEALVSGARKPEAVRGADEGEQGDDRDGRVEELREALRRLLALRDEQASGAYRPGSLGKRYKLAWDQAAELVGWHDGPRE